MESLKGQLLIAPPKIIDRRFNNTVIYLVNHSDEGAWGIILNKPSPVTAQEVLARAGMDLYIPGMVHAGGPVNLSTVHFLHTGTVLTGDSQYNKNGIVCNSDMQYLVKLHEGRDPGIHRMFVGVCSWAPGQLEGEIMGESPWTKDHSWLLAPSDPEIIFQYDELEQWQAAINHCAASTVKDWM